MVKSNFHIGKEHLDKLFPFYFRMDQDLLIIEAGKGLVKLFPDLLNSSFSTFFQFQRPSLSIQENYESISEYLDQIFILKSKLGTKSLQLRGQMLIVEKQLMFVGSPWMTNVDDLDKYGLLVTDFAIHDPVTDMLQVMQVRELALNDIESQRDQLAEKNKVIADLAKFPAENPNPILRIGLSGRIRYANKISELLLDSWGCRVGGKLPVALEKAFSDVIKSNQGIEAEIVVNDRFYLFQFTPFIEEDYINVYGKDITEIKKIEVSLKESKIKAEESLRFKERFLANMSHEIRTPMNGILGMSKLLTGANLSGKYKMYLSSIQKSASNLLVIINDILDLSKIEADKLELEKIGFKLNKLIGNSILGIEYLASEKDLFISNNIDSILEDAILIGDPVRLNQIITNLLSNALKFTHSGQVNVGAKVIAQIGDKVKIQFFVADTGIGIPKEKLNTVFKSFKQVDETTTRKYGGTGLGLSITKSLVKLHEGEIWVESEEKKGTTFFFEITYSLGTENDLVIDESIEMSSYDLEGKHVLLVEDHKINQVYAMSILEDHGLIVDLVENGKEAISKLKIVSYDLILMDMQMPVMGGVEATQIIREEMKLDTPIIALTANALKGDEDKYLKQGMNQYISKPFEDVELITKIGDLLGAQVGLVSHKEVHDTIAENNQEDISNNKPLYSLSKLENISRGKDAFVYKMIDVFLEETPKTIKQLVTHLKNKNYDGIAAVAHKMKSSIGMLSIDSLHDEIRLLEDLRTSPLSHNEVDSLVTQVDVVSVRVMNQLTSLQK